MVGWFFWLVVGGCLLVVFFGSLVLGFLLVFLVESLILAQDERWRRA